MKRPWSARVALVRRLTRRAIVATLAAVAPLVFVAMLATPVRALDVTSRSGPVEARVAVSPEAPRIGDAITLDIEVYAEPGIELLMPDFGEALDRFRVVDFVPRERVEVDGRTHASQRYTLHAPASGEHRVPPILVEFVDRRPGHDPAPEGQDAYELLTDAIDFTVESVVPDSARAALSPPLGRLDPIDRGIRARWPWLLAVLAGLAALGPLAWRAHRRRRARAAVRSAWQVARAELDALVAAPLPELAHIDPWFVALSGIVRRYLEARFAVRSPELTTERFLEVVSGSPELTDDHQALLRDFLRQCDLVKFAHVIPTEASIRQAIEAAARFIDDTREAPGTAEPTERLEGAAA